MKIFCKYHCSSFLIFAFYGNKKKDTLLFHVKHTPKAFVGFGFLGFWHEYHKNAMKFKRRVKNETKRDISRETQEEYQEEKEQG